MPLSTASRGQAIPQTSHPQRAQPRYDAKAGIRVTLDCPPLQVNGSLVDVSASGFAMMLDQNVPAEMSRYLTTRLIGQRAQVGISAFEPAPRGVAVTRFDTRGDYIRIAARFSQGLSAEQVKLLSRPVEETGHIDVVDGVMSVQGPVDFRNAVAISRAASAFRGIRIDLGSVTRIDFPGLAAIYNALHKKAASISRCSPAIQTMMRRGKVCEACPSSQCHNHPRHKVSG